MKALADNIKKFEQANGEIDDNEKHPSIPLNFGPAGQA
jgi:hypothetical protein